MATKTTSKSAARKPAATKTAAKATTHARKPAPAAASKAKPALEKAESDRRPSTTAAPAAKHRAEPAAKPAAPKPVTPRRDVETVSLIDEKKPKKKTADGEHKKATILPPISRIRASLEGAGRRAEALQAGRA